MAEHRLFTAESAAARLGVSRATLYAYVSRGLVHAYPAPDDPRRRLYSATDIRRLLGNKTRGRKAVDIAAATLDYGLPALASGITLIEDDRLSFRGRDAARLAAHATLEETARLLWDCSQDPFVAAPLVAPSAASLIASLADAFPLDRCMAVLPVAGVGTAMTWQRDQRRLWHDGAMLLRLMAAAATGTTPSDAPTHLHVARAWGLDDRAAEAIRAALVLCADHELNTSAFAVRVVASTGASLAACVSAGLRALSAHGTAARPASLRSCSRNRSASARRRGWCRSDCGAATYCGRLEHPHRPNPGRNEWFALAGFGAGRKATEPALVAATRRRIRGPQAKAGRPPQYKSKS